jgi:hypothetical protein
MDLRYSDAEITAHIEQTSPSRHNYPEQLEFGDARTRVASQRLRLE